MKIASLALVIIVGIVAAGCRRNSTPPPTAPPLAPPQPMQPVNAVGGNTLLTETKYFKGSIGTSLDLQMKLYRTGDQLSGSYFYQRIGSRINLRGKIEADGRFVLDEFDPAGKQTGVFKGLWTVDAQDGLIRLAGNWSKPPGEKGSDKMTAFSVQEEPIALSGDVDLSAKQIKETNKKLMYEIAAQYPQFSGGNNPNFEKFNQAVRASVPIYDAGSGRQTGYASSSCWSPLLKRYIALGHVEAKHAKPGTAIELEMTVEHRRKRAAATIRDLPFFDPPRKRA